MQPAEDIHLLADYPIHSDLQLTSKSFHLSVPQFL